MLPDALEGNRSARTRHFC